MGDYFQIFFMTPLVEKLKANLSVAGRISFFFGKWSNFFKKKAFLTKNRAFSTRFLLQGDQKGRCQKYLLISPKLFEPQKYIIHSWVPENWTFMLVCLPCIFLHICVLYKPSLFFWLFSKTQFFQSSAMFINC